MRYAQNQKIGKPTNSKHFGSKKNKGPKQDNQNCLRPHMRMREENFSLNNNYIK